MFIGAAASSSLNPKPKKLGGGTLKTSLAAFILDIASSPPITITT